MARYPEMAPFMQKLTLSTTLAASGPVLIMGVQVKKIAYVLATFPVLSETFVGTEMRAMEARGHGIVPIVMRRPDPGMPMQAADADLAGRAVYLDSGNCGGFATGTSGVGGITAAVSMVCGRAGAVTRVTRALSFAGRQRGLPARSLVWNAARIAALAQRYGCGHLHAHFAGGAAAHALVAARLIGATASFVGHGHDVYGSPSDLEVKLLEADFAVAVCEDMAVDMRALAPGSRVETVPCGIDPGRFPPPPDGEQDNGRLLFVGRLVEQKGVDDLLAALALLPDDRRPGLDIVGTGPLRDRVEMLTAEAGLRDVRLLGAQPGEWIAMHGPFYRAMVVPFRLGSGGERDTGPLVVKEAMAMRLPVISTSFMGVKDTVAADTGILVEPGDVGALAGAIRRVDDMSVAERRCMGWRGRRRVVDLFTAERQAERLSALVEAA